MPRNHWNSTRAELVGLLALAGAVSCSSGSIGDPLQGMPGLSPGSAGASSAGAAGAGSAGAGIGGAGNPNGTGGAAGTMTPDSLDCTNAARSPGPSFIRRLNRFEYNNTVRDLLGDATAPASAFPTEEMRLGFDNNATALQVSPALAEQYLTAAETLASTAAAQSMSNLVPCDPTAAGCSATFIQDFGQKAYRRPLSSDETATLTQVFNVGAMTDFKTGVRLVVETVLQSPAFLYRVEFGAPANNGETIVGLTSWEMASRLSYLIWQSMPDDTLRAAAAADELTTTDQITAQVNRMMGDQKAHDVFAHFHEQWLELGKLDVVSKDATAFPSFTSDVVDAMGQETRQFLDYVVWNGAGTLDALLTSPVSFMNAKLASYYGVSGPAGTAFSRVDLDPATHAGILTQGGIMAMLGKTNQTAPVQRGKFVREQLLCTMLPPPPANIMIKAPDLSPTLSTCERFAAHRTQTLCANCHDLMDPIGLGFENYDGAGHYRTTENGKMIDASGQVNQSDIPGTFNGAVELAHALSGSDQVRSCVSTSWFRYAYGRAETTDDACTLVNVNKQFAASQYNLKALVAALAQTDAFLYRKVIPAGGAQ